MSGKNGLTDVFTYAFVVGGILVLTRPKSQGPGLVRAFLGGITGLVQGATGQKVTAHG